MGEDTALEVRIDKWLWATRIYKTRSLAADACRGGHVKVDGIGGIKPAKALRIGETIEARVGERLRIVKVTGLVEKRVGAKLVEAYLEDHSPKPEPRTSEAAPVDPGPTMIREKGAGRPTKRDRREIERFFG